MISRRDFIKTASLGAASLAIQGCSDTAEIFSRQPSTQKPNIIFILADDLGWADVGYHGSEIKTPNIDKLAAGGAQLNQFYVQPVCSPTRSSLLTGRYPIRYGMQVSVIRPWAEHGLALNESTLPQALKNAGYYTAVCGKWHLGHLGAEYLPTSRGFDYQYGHYNGMIDYFTHYRNGGHDWSRNDKPLQQEGYTTELIGTESVELIRRHDTSKPLFLYVPFNAPHYPWQAPKKYLDMCAHIEDIKQRTYAAMVTCMDDQIGRIITAVEKKGLKHNTLIIFCSDNGGTSYVGSNAPLRNYKGSLYEGGVRVPAAAYWPGKIKAGTFIDQPLHIVDIYPTLLKLAGASLGQPLPLDGRDVWPVITQDKPSPHDEILINCTPFHGAIRCGDWKLVHNGRLEATYLSPDVDDDNFELFNLSSDPFERVNLIEKYPDKFQELKNRLDEYRAQAQKPFISPNKMPQNFKVPKDWGH